MDRINNQKILLTGGTGFIGSALCQSLRAQGFMVRILVRDTSRFDAATDPKGLEVIAGDLLDAAGLETACADQHTIIHLAGPAHVNNNDVAAARHTIVDGTKNLLSAAIKSHAKRFVYVSSSLAEAASTGTGDVTDYGRLKKAAEDVLLEAHARGLIEVVIFRPVNVYGLGMKGNIAGMISLIARKRLPPLPALGSRISLVGVTDLVQALNLGVTAEQAAGRIYTVTDGQVYPIQKIESAIYAALGRRIPRWRTPRVLLFAAALTAGFVTRFQRRGSAIGLRTYRNITRDNLFDNSPICLELGYQPRTTLYRELPQIVTNILQKKSG